MTAPESEALAAWLDASAAVEDIPWPERAAKSRAAAAALRGLVAERDSLRDEAWAWMLCWGEEMANNERLRRKVARYIGKARVALRNERMWHGAVRGWEGAAYDRMRERDSAVALGRELAQATDDSYRLFNRLYLYYGPVDVPGMMGVLVDLLAKARAAGWLEGK